MEPGTRESAWTPLSPEGSLSHRILLHSLGNLPGTSWHLSSNFNQVRQRQPRPALKAQILPLRTHLLRIELKPQQRSLWSKKPHKQSAQSKSESPFLLQSSSILLRMDRSGRGRRDTDSHLPLPALLSHRSCPSERPSLRASCQPLSPPSPRRSAPSGPSI